MIHKLIVSAYKIVGFAILVCILLGLTSFVVTAGFYYVSASWMAPVIISPTDKRVVELKAQLVQEQTLRDGVAAQREAMLARLKDAERTVSAEQAYQAALRVSLKRDVSDHELAVGKLVGLRREYGEASVGIAQANDDFAGLSRERMREMFAAHLVSRDELLRGNMQLAALTGAKLNLSERNAELDEKLLGARRQADGFKRLSSSLAGGHTYADREGLPREALIVERDHELSVRSMKRAVDEAAALKGAIENADTTLGRYDAILRAITASPQLLAIDQKLTVGFVPYANLAAARPGAPVYGCRGNIVWCRKVGKVGRRLEGEITGHHPVQKIELRGVMVQIDLDEATAAEEPVLHVGRAPLFI